MILIELVRNFIRPITLSVRLAANIVAGHLLIRLINGGDPLSLSASIIIIGGLLLFFLEVGVAFIQGYVFSTLRVMYLSELNHNIIL
jgi:F0F1-type ATP synthase membrane subunit a